MTTRGVLYYSFTDGTGYGRAALAYIDYLLDQGIPLRWEPMISRNGKLQPWSTLADGAKLDLNGVSARQDRALQTVNKDVAYDTVFMHCVPEVFQELHESDKRNIGYVAWETSTLPRAWPDLFRPLDHLLVPCQANHVLFSKTLDCSVSSLPHLSETNTVAAENLSRDQLRVGLNIDKSTLVFYSISAWVPRKSVYQTLHNFCSAFTAADDVCLIFKTERQGIDYSSVVPGPGSQKLEHRFTREMVEEIRRAYSEPPRIILIDAYISDAAMLGLHKMSDCFYSLTHGEGWSLGAYTAASMGNSVLITGWGGQLDYLPKDMAYRVDYQLATVPELVGWESYTSDQQWAVADDAHTQSLLKSCLANRTEVKRRGQLLKDHIEQNFSRQRIGAMLMQVIDEH